MSTVTKQGGGSYKVTGHDCCQHLPQQTNGLTFRAFVTDHQSGTLRINAVRSYGLWIGDVQSQLDNCPTQTIRSQAAKPVFPISVISKGWCKRWSLVSWRRFDMLGISIGTPIDCSRWSIWAASLVLRRKIVSLHSSRLNHYCALLHTTNLNCVCHHEFQYENIRCLHFHPFKNGPINHFLISHRCLYGDSALLWCKVRLAAARIMGWAGSSNGLVIEEDGRRAIRASYLNQA